MAKKRRKHEQTIPDKKPRSPAWILRLDTELYAVLVIVAVWVLAAVLINPRGNFPLNDDWCYGKAVYTLLRTHHFHMVGIVTMTLVAQVLWGALFCSIFGLSFTVLRVSTLILGLGGLLAAYGLLREAKAPRWIASFGCVVIALNPLYVALSYSFMSDVPFLAVSLMALYAYVKALRHDSMRMIVLGTALAVVAVLIRQIGLFLLIGFGLAYLTKDGARVKSVLRAVVPLLITAAVLIAYTCWLRSTHNLPKYFNIQAVGIQRFLAAGPVGWVKTAWGVVLTSYVYLGLFLLPFLILNVPRQWRDLTSRQRGANFLISVISALVVAITLIRERRWIPMNRATGDYIMDFGIGPPTLRDVWVERTGAYPMMPEAFWIVVTAAAVIGGALLMWHLLAAFQRLSAHDTESASPFSRAFLVLMLVVTALNLSTLIPLTSFIYFDRYFVSVVPLLAVVIALTTAPSAKTGRLYIVGALVTLVLIGCFSIGGTHDYMTWNRLRWHAAGEIIRTEQITPQEVDGGHEFNAWHGYDESTRTWDTFDDYVITFGPMRGYDEVADYTYTRWMPLSTGHVFLLSRAVY